MPQVFSMSMKVDGVVIWVNYNASNLRITTVEWTIPIIGIVAHVQIWNNTVLVYDRTIVGPASGLENVPGNHTLVEKISPIGLPYLWLPDNLTYRINVESSA